MELPYTDQRVKQHTADNINYEIQTAIRQSVDYYQANPEFIDERLMELNREWDIERVLEANASTIILLASTLGFAVNKKFFILPLAVGAFLLQHALQGWCPPLPILRRLGFRTTSEIQQERSALEGVLRAYNQD